MTFYSRKKKIYTFIRVSAPRWCQPGQSAPSASPSDATEKASGQWLKCNGTQGNAVPPPLILHFNHCQWCHFRSEWSTTVQRKHDVSDDRIHRQRRPGSPIQRRQHGYVRPSCRHNATNSWIEDRSSRRPVSRPGAPGRRPENCFDHPRRISCRAPWQHQSIICQSKYRTRMSSTSPT